ncbi:hypothetical protein TrLO_g11293 [Triparma laevis f. longispina]|uniref:Uncharacterized protein n=1 Tax=Triparma laevis f. longispina TaxID=1714387 RepID=A0A9W6ZVY2_9STRA|nr:hypothetical protein TrLO_g11293 [Triparma laevis f. longispina]
MGSSSSPWASSWWRCLLASFYFSFVRPSSSIWKAGAIRAITSAYTRGHTEGISCVCVIKATSHTPHGEDLIFTSGREDGKIKVWSSETGRLLRSFMGHQKGVNHMSTNADQTNMYTAKISSSDGGEIREWDLTTPNVRVPTWTAFLADVSDITSVLAEKDLIFTFGFIHDRKNTPLFSPHQLSPALLKHHSAGWGTDFTSSDIKLQTLYEFGKGAYRSRVRYNDKSYSADGVELYDGSTWQRSHSRKITAMCYAPTSYCQGQLITERSKLNTPSKNYFKDNSNSSHYMFFFTSSLDGTCKAWSAEYKRCIGTFSTGVAAPPLYTLTVHPITGQLFAGADDGTVKVWNCFVHCDDRGVIVDDTLSPTKAKTGKKKKGGSNYGETLSDYSYSSTTTTGYLTFVFDICNDGISSRNVPNPNDLIPRNLRDKHSNEVRSISFSNDHRVLLSASLDGKVKSWACPSVTSVFDDANAQVMYRGTPKDVGVLLSDFQVGSPVRSLSIGPKVPVTRRSKKEKQVNKNKDEDEEEFSGSKDKLYAAGDDDVVTIWECYPEDVSNFRNKGEFRSAGRALIDIATLTVQMLGFPFGEDMRWSEEVEPIQYSLPIFQMEFKVTPALFLFQFWEKLS